MEKMKSFFGYIHYRVYLLFKEKGDNVPEFKGTLILSLIQCFTIVDIMVMVKIVYDYPFPNKHFFLPLLIVVGFLNWYMYERNFDIKKLDCYWKNESPEVKARKGWLIASYILIAMLMPIVYGYLKVNLNVI
jgi:energy-coupling factor transporter transmembrane protein EcfT